MLLQDKESGSLIEIKDVQELINPNQDTLKAQRQTGEEEQDPADYRKDNLTFPSGEDLPLCWKDPNYRNAT